VIYTQRVLPGVGIILGGSSYLEGKGEGKRGIRAVDCNVDIPKWRSRREARAPWPWRSCVQKKEEERRKKKKKKRALRSRGYFRASRRSHDNSREGGGRGGKKGKATASIDATRVQGRTRRRATPRGERGEGRGRCTLVRAGLSQVANQKGGGKRKERKRASPTTPILRATRQDASHWSRKVAKRGGGGKRGTDRPQFEPDHAGSSRKERGGEEEKGRRRRKAPVSTAMDASSWKKRGRDQKSQAYHTVVEQANEEKEGGGKMKFISTRLDQTTRGIAFLGLSPSKNRRKKRKGRRRKGGKREFEERRKGKKWCSSRSSPMRRWKGSPNSRRRKKGKKKRKGKLAESNADAMAFAAELVKPTCRLAIRREKKGRRRRSAVSPYVEAY